MLDPTSPILAIYVVWHPAFEQGQAIASEIQRHFRRDPYQNLSGGRGLSVLFRNTQIPGSPIPLSIDFGEAHTTAVVVLIEPNLLADTNWIEFINEMSSEVRSIGLGSRIFPVAIDPSATRAGILDQALRWDQWQGADESRLQRLISELTYEFCRMSRHYLEHLNQPQERYDALEAYLKKVQIFLSHSKHDSDGNRVALAIRTHLHAGHGLASFFDIHDIPAGLRFDDVLLHQVRTSAIIAIHTDSYSSREWCRREIIEAKRSGVPLIVANCINQIDERGFPYLGNVPIVRMDPIQLDRIELVISRLLDEVLKSFLWRCLVKLTGHLQGGEAIFLSRTPELVSLTALGDIHSASGLLVVYPDPPMSSEEEQLLESVAPLVRLKCLTSWLAEAPQ